MSNGSRHDLGLQRFLYLLVLFGCFGTSLTATSPNDAAGIWEAKHDYGPVLRGPLVLTRSEGEWIAEIAGQRIRVNAPGNAITWVFPGGQGEFHGVFDAQTDEIRGHWIQPPTINSQMRYASPVTLRAFGNHCWRGPVDPLEDEFTLFLVASPGQDGTVHAFLRNPDRNLGVFLEADRLEQEGNAIRLLGHLRDDKEKGEQVLATGAFHRGRDRRRDHLSLYFPTLGSTFDFAPADDDAASSFYARGKSPGEFHYIQPPPEDDGWPVGSLEEAGIAQGPLKRLIETVIDPPAKSVHDFYIHGILIARGGRLVFEEYFHGYSRDKPHDTRSASKSLTATLVGSVIDHEAPLATATPVYKTIYGDRLPSGLDPRKREMTVENLLMMASGYYCDDRNPASPGNEDVMQSQTADPDWYHYTLNLPMISNPGEQPVYCSADPNLLGDVLSHATGKPLTELFQERIADPLQIRRYYLYLSPTGDPYMGGGIYWLPRDFMKLGQVMLNGGTWNGQRIVSSSWAHRATAPLEKLRKLQYGNLWWSISYPYHSKTVRAFFAGGNGGQLVMGLPDLDLVVAIYAGNYYDPVLYKIQEELVPQYVLPAVNPER